MERKGDRQIILLNQYATPNEAAKPYINAADLKNPGIWPTPEIIESLRFIKDHGKKNTIIDQAWTRVKSH
jgi:spermidine/putrescine transport system substrate-binding protein